MFTMTATHIGDGNGQTVKNQVVVTTDMLFDVYRMDRYVMNNVRGFLNLIWALLCCLDFGCRGDNIWLVVWV